MKLHWSVKQGGIIVKRIQRALAHTKSSFPWLLLALFTTASGNNQSILQIRLGWFEGILCVLGGTNTPSGQQFDRGAIITLLSKSGDRIYMDHWMPTRHSWRKKHQCSKEQFGTGQRVPASWGVCNMSGSICGFFYKHDKIEGIFKDWNRMALIKGWLLDRCGH